MSTKKQDIFAISGLAVLLGAGIPAVAMAEARVGVASAVNPDATSGGAGQTTRTITLGDAVIHNQVINTSGAGLVQVLLADGTTFTVGPNSSLTIDRFIYDPDAGTAKVSASLSKGFMRFIGGRTSKTEGDATINTPIGTAGIRGAVVDIDLGQIGQKPKRDGRDGRDGKKDKQKDETPPHVSLIFGHEVTLSFNGVSNRLFQAGYSIVVDGGGRTVVRTPLPFLQAMQERLASHGGANGGVPRPPRDEQVAKAPFPATIPTRPCHRMCRCRREGRSCRRNRQRAMCRAMPVWSRRRTRPLMQQHPPQSARPFGFSLLARSQMAVATAFSAVPRQPTARAL